VKNILMISSLFVAISFFSWGFPVMPAFAQDVDKVQELQRIIETQQKQLEMQREQFKAQQQQLDEQMQLMQQLQSQVKTLAEDSKATTIVQTPVKAEDTKTDAHVSRYASHNDSRVNAENVITTPAPEKVKLSISGLVNRAVSVIDDGDETDVYYIDNDNVESRVNFVGTAKIDDDLTLGSRIELTIAPNKASAVNQNDQESGDTFEQRWAEVSLDSKRFGKVSLGRGFTASFGIASSDLSGTTNIATSTIVDLAGGMLFRQESNDELTDLEVNFAFSDFNGLSRKNRLRYDSPSFYGAHFAVSAVSDDRQDAGLYWAAKGYGFKYKASGGLADPNEENVDLQYAGSASVLHEGTGLNLSLATGSQERDNQSDATNFFTKVGWMTRPFSFGATAFSIDHTTTRNFPTEDDEGHSYALAATQQFDKYGAELYAIYRNYSLDRDVEPEVQDIDVFSLGALVKF
jgi:predicted porin